MAEGIELTEYDKTMQRLAKEFEEALKEALAFPYPFAPGFNKQRHMNIERTTITLHHNC